jgi:hypothetical protein
VIINVFLLQNVTWNVIYSFVRFQQSFLNGFKVQCGPSPP